jgi:c-di-GMP-binding flagellar brake protein YcgR
VPLEVLRADGDGVIEVLHSVDMRRNQLRQFVRIEVNLPLKLRLIRTADPNSSPVPLGTVVEARMADISGGGMSFLCDRSLRPGDLIAATFSLPSCNFATVSCKVLRVSLQEGKTRTHYRHHAQFVNLETARRDAIVRFVFEKMRLLSQWS